MKSNIFYALLLSVFLFSACKNNRSENGLIQDDVIPVKIIPVTKDTLSTSFHSSGYFTTEDETPLSFKNGGIVQAIYVKEGDAVKKGQILARVNGTEIQAAAQQAELAYQKALRDFQRATNLYHDSVATLEQMQNAKTALELARQQKSSVDFNNQHSEIRALSNGVVIKKYLNEGQMASPGMPVLLVSSSAKSGWIFKTGVSDFQWSSIFKGDRAEISTDAAPGKIINATVLRKSEGVDPQTGAFTIQLSVKNPAGLPLASGLFGKATLFPSGKSSGWSIPYGSLLDGDENSGFVFVTSDKQHAQKLRVSISRIEHNKVIIDSGLTDVHYLIVSGSAYLKDGSAIKVID